MDRRRFVKMAALTSLVPAAMFLDACGGGEAEPGDNFNKNFDRYWDGLEKTRTIESVTEGFKYTARVFRWTIGADRGMVAFFKGIKPTSRGNGNICGRVS